jgi:hypothetical protein
MDNYNKQINNHIKLLILDSEDCRARIAENERRIVQLQKENNLTAERIQLNVEAISIAEDSRSNYNTHICNETN